MKTNFLKLILFYSLFILISPSCKKNHENKNDFELNKKEKIPLETNSSSTGNEDLDEMGQKIISIFEQISMLSESNYCTYKSILNADLSLEEKMDSIGEIDSLNDLHYAISQLNEFVSNNDQVLEKIDNIEDEGNQYLSKFIFTSLGGIEFDIPNDPCGAYKTGLTACGSHFLSCCILGGLSGPITGGVIIGLCGVDLLFCVNAIDAQYPGCVPSGGSLPTIQHLWLNLETACSQ